MAEMRLVVAGGGGRMGRTLVRAIAETPGVALSGATEPAGSPLVGEDAGTLAGLGPNGIRISTDLTALAAQADGILDFTIPLASVAAAAIAAQAGVVHVIGTTGFSPEDETKIKAAAAGARIVKSGNMSLGVNLLAALVRRVARTLDDQFDIEVLEMHHSRKIDAPSGTALLLGRAAADGRGIDLSQRKVLAREGHTGARRAGDIGFATLRGGTVVGEHSVIFAGPAERIELVHRAEDRSLFANGALKAALWARSQPPGLYTMADVLGLGEF
ncbi:MAG TPA: 4-hydroxy-tetrahydrodipicolinate reductase [Xanthobacteraceae bacterium]|nr:4-hydroxy-tetrahydrodipicolinate reductase [Xanthobacteraceae bacterium]